MSGWLHMGGPAPKSTLNLARPGIAARRFVVRWQPEWKATLLGRRGGRTPVEWVLGEGGLAAALALLAEAETRSPYSFDELAERARRFEGTCGSGALAEAVESVLAAARIPRRIGVFADPDSRRGDDTRVPDGVALAILLRRSGPLFMPAREPRLELLVPAETTLVFPEDPDVDPE
jgi:hypothetical protein